MKIYSLLFIAMFVISCASTRNLNTAEYDVGLKVVPLSVKALLAGDQIDVIETTPENIKEAPNGVVTFRIVDVFKGEFSKIKVGGDSKMGQLKNALSKGDVLKIVTLDFNDPEEEVMKEWVNVAVWDPEETFGIKDWQNPEQKTYRLYLDRLAEDEHSYILVKSEKR